MSTKKQFVELMSYLTTNKDKKVADILEDIKQFTEVKKNANTVIYKNDKPIAIFCYYHKQWELLSEVEYGKKASHKSGYNTMCKVGTNQWTKQQAEARKSKEQLLDDVENGKVKPQDLKARLNEIEEHRLRIEMKGAPKGTKNPPQTK